MCERPVCFCETREAYREIAFPLDSRKNRREEQKQIFGGGEEEEKEGKESAFLLPKRVPTALGPPQDLDFSSADADSSLHTFTGNCSTGSDCDD